MSKVPEQSPIQFPGILPRLLSSDMISFRYIDSNQPVVVPCADKFFPNKWIGSLILDEFRQDVLDYAGRFSLPYAASKAIGNIKRSVQSGLEIPLEYHLALERELQSDLFQSEDAKEGIKAYVDKKTARFEGR